MMDKIRAIIHHVLVSFELNLDDAWNKYRIEITAKELARRLEPYLKGPKIPIKELSDLAGWLK